MSRRSKLKTDDSQKLCLIAGKDTKIPLTCMKKPKHPTTIQDKNVIQSQHPRLYSEVSNLQIKYKQNKVDKEANKLFETYVKMIVEKQLPSCQNQFNVIDKLNKIFILVKEYNQYRGILQTWMRYLQKVCAYLQYQVVMVGRQRHQQMLAINCLRLRTMYMKCMNLEEQDLESALEEGIKILQYVVANYQFQQIAKNSNYLQWIQTHIIQLLRCLQFLNSLAQVDNHSIINKLSQIYLSYLNQHIFTIQILQLLEALSTFQSQKEDLLLFIVNSFNFHLNLKEAQIFILILCHHANCKIATQGWKKWLSYFWYLCDKDIDCEQLLSTLSIYLNVEMSQIFTTIFSEHNQIQNHVNSFENTYLDNAMHHLLEKSSKISWQLAFRVSLRMNKLLKCIYSKSKDSQLSANLLLFLQKQIISKVYFGAQQYQIIYQSCRRYVSIKLLCQLYEFVPKFVSSCQSVILLQKSFDQLCQMINNMGKPIFVENQLIECLVNVYLTLKLMQNNETRQKEKGRHTKLTNILLRTSNMQRDTQQANKYSQKILRWFVRVGKPLNLQKQLLQTVTLIILNKNISEKQNIFTQLMQTAASVQDPRLNQQHNFTFYFKNASLSHICQINIQLHLLVPLLSNQPGVMEEHKLWLARLKTSYVVQIETASLNNETNNARVGFLLLGLLNKIKSPSQMISDCKMQQECYEMSQDNRIVDETKILIQLLQNLDNMNSFTHPMCKTNTKTHRSHYNLNQGQASQIDQEISQQIILQYLQQLNWQINTLLAVILSYWHLGYLIDSLSMCLEESIQFQIFQLAATMFRGVKLLINRVCYNPLAQNKIKEWLSNNLKIPILLRLDHFLIMSSHSNRNLSKIIQALQGNFTNYQHLSYLPQVHQMNKNISSILISFAQYKGIQGIQHFISESNLQKAQETAQIVKIQGKIRIIRKVNKQAE